MKSLKFAFIQSGYCVFGVGYTRRQAISDARKWLDSPDGARGGLSFQSTENLLSDDNVHGGFKIIGCEHPEFDSYMKNQGGFVRRGRGWYKARTINAEGRG